MPLKNISEMTQSLNNYDARSWSKKVDLEGINSGDLAPKEASKTGSGSQSFAEFLATSLSEVNKLQQDANIAMEKLASGQTTNLHETMLAVEKADLAFRTMNQVRNKVISAYQEIMKMQI
jgi:flagellar hook-basal body complex protein FliE